MNKIRIYDTWASHIDQPLINRLTREIPMTMNIVTAELSLVGMQIGNVLSILDARGYANQSRRFHNAVCELNAQALDATSRTPDDEPALDAITWRNKKWQYNRT